MDVLPLGGPECFKKLAFEIFQEESLARNSLQ
jgi:hypothetical protein